MSRELRLCPGVGGRKCVAFLSSLDRDSHPTCTRCRGRVCTRDLTCDICAEWSSAQWDLFAKKRSYAERKHHSRPSGSVPPSPKTSPHARTSSEVKHPEASSSSSSLPSGGQVKRGGLGMHLVLHPVRLPLLPLDLGPARGLEVSLPVFPDLRIEEQGRIVEPALCRPALVTGLVDLALAPLPAHGQAVESVVDGTRLVRCPPACGRGGTDRCLLTAIGRVASCSLSHQCLGEIGRDLRTATTLGATGRDLRIATGLGGSVRDPLLVGEVTVTARDHKRGRLSPLAVRVQGIEADEPDVRNGRVWRLLLSPWLPLSQKLRPQWLLLLRGVL